ncbi:MAG: hypothetical protein IPO58_21180 [Betaproteobacteria bacterium]|nr:hypothetical protein [Betaproteobacteria bacterium]
MSLRLVCVPAGNGGPPSMLMAMLAAVQCQPLIAPMPDCTDAGAGTSRTPWAWATDSVAIAMAALARDSARIPV